MEQSAITEARLDESGNRNLHRTRIDGLGYIKAVPGLWRFVDLHDGINTTRYVGPNYKTEKELLADLDRYAREAWGYGVSGNGELKDYMVGIQEGDDGFWSFYCQATDVAHAREQALAHGSEIKVLSVYEKVA